MGTAAFVQQLRELGWIEGRNIAIDYRWAEGRFDRSAQIIGEFVRLDVDVIVTHATANVIAAKQMTSIIPIVFAAAGDPVGNGLVASLAQPGGIVTGMSVQSPDLAGKRLQFLREVFPGLRQVAVLVEVGNPVTVLEQREVQAAARETPCHSMRRSRKMAEAEHARRVALSEIDQRLRKNPAPG